MKKEKNKEINIVFLLDRSGSMHGTETDTIGGYNSYIKSRIKDNAYVTTILFDDKYEMINKNTPIKNIKELTEKEYYTRGSTALLDAIGKSISYMNELNKKKVIFIITTDGYENSSTKYTKEEIKKLISIHDNWEFIYIGANIDSYTEASSIGIKATNTANYEKNRQGITNLFGSISKLSKMYYEEDYIDKSWKEDLE
ncbi:MAG: VWA domain-containing protein [Bacilli bacterium]|nr:VWA domain-containing protein [Bacilli bacterium]